MPAPNSTASADLSQYSNNPSNLLNRLGSDRLPPQVRRFVAHLIAHRGNLVSDQDIHAHLWPQAKYERYKVTQEALRARTYLGDERPYKLIVNVRGYGYRWGGPLEGGTE